MTATPVVLVDLYNCKHVLLPLPQDLRAHKTLATQAKTQATCQLPVSTPSPPEAQSQSLPGANLRKRVHLDATPTHGVFCHPVAKATPPGPTDGYETPNSSSFQELIGASPLFTRR